MSDSSSFYLLDEQVQRFIWTQGWTELRDAQEQAIPLLVNADRDVIIAAATAAGKTEAAFLPSLTHLLRPENDGKLILYISPLKALINDQFGRLDLLCEELKIPVWPWHGDISSSLKTRFYKKPAGVLLITPESVEAMLCNRGSSTASIFKQLAYIVIDELHAFIGSERGKQLQSLMHRIELAIGRTVPRIGLSATLGDMRLGADFLRPAAGAQVAIIDSKENRPNLQILVKGFEEPVLVKKSKNNSPAEKSYGESSVATDDSGKERNIENAEISGRVESDEDDEDEEPEAVTPEQVAVHLFQNLRGENNLIFPNSRREVERYTHLLSRMCEKAQVPNEFWPHHGNLSKEIRAETEAALKRKDRCATAVCTNTLELGIDIGAVNSVAQIGPPPSVASLRQRLGRSGRRPGKPAVLRGYCIENAITPQSDLATQLRVGTVQMVAMITLLIEGWFEPPATKGVHLSTLVQQLLSMISERGGINAAQGFKALLSEKAPFAGLSQNEYMGLLRHLGSLELLMQESSGLLLHAPVGERYVNHYTFYAAFATEEEFRLVAGSRIIGSLAVSHMLTPGQHILFGGKTWRVEEINEREKTIVVARSRAGKPPTFTGGVGRVHTVVRQRMRRILREDEPVTFLDTQGKRFLTEARDTYRRMALDNQIIIDSGGYFLIATWSGDAVNDVIAALFTSHSISACSTDLGVVVAKSGKEKAFVIDVLNEACAKFPSTNELLEGAANLDQEKWDWALPKPLLQKAYASLYLDTEGAKKWLKENIAAAAPETENN